MQNRLSFLIFQESADANGGSIISHIKINDPGVALLQFLVLNCKDAAFHNDNAHVQTHVLHGNYFSLERFAINGTVIHGSRFLLGCSRTIAGKAGNHRRAHGIHGLKERFTLQVLTCLDFHIHLHTELRKQAAADCRDTLQQHILAIGHQVNM